MSCCRLLVNFTQPVILSFPESHTHKDLATTKCIIEVSQYLRQYKEVHFENTYLFPTPHVYLLL